MSNMSIGWDNLVTYATLAAGSAARNMPVTNLQDDTGAASVAWQTEAAVVTAADGATITITPSTPRAWRLFGLFGTNLTSGAVATVTLYNKPATLVFTATLDAVVAGYGQAVLDAGQDYSADYCVIAIDDPTNPDGFINVPLAFAGPAWVPEIGMGWQSTIGRDSQIDETVAKGGQEYPVPRWERRRWNISLSGKTDTELWDDAQELDRVARFGRNVLFLPDISTVPPARGAVMGRLESGADIAFTSRAGNRFLWQFKIRERL